MSKTKTTIPAKENEQIENAVNRLRVCVIETERSLKCACASALEAGYHLLWIKQNSGDNPFGISVPRGTLIPGKAGRPQGTGLTAILAEVGIARRTAYRWMNATHIALGRLGHEGYCDDPEKYPIPAPETPESESLLEELRELAATMSLSRLMLGAGEEKGDIMRQEVIITKMETAENEQEQALYEGAVENVEMGKWSLIQAMRAVGSQEAAEVAAERRANIVYCDIDPVDGRPIGVAPKAIVSLANSLKHWDEMPQAAKDSLRNMWKELAAQLPEDF